jgi:hypothetical protein
MPNDKADFPQQKSETENQTDKSTKPEDKEAPGEIHPETDNPDELDPRLFSPLQAADAAPPEERIPEIVPTEEPSTDNESEEETDQPPGGS